MIATHPTYAGIADPASATNQRRVNWDCREPHLELSQTGRNSQGTSATIIREVAMVAWGANYGRVTLKISTWT